MSEENKQHPVDNRHVAPSCERFSNPIDGGSAFPLPDAEPGFRCSEPGISLRDYFAAKAMEGMFSAQHLSIATSEIVKMAYEAADAMLAERDSERQSK